MRRPSNAGLVLTGGLAYGAALAFLAWICAGGGHGTLAPAVITSAPFSAMNVLVGLLVSPIIWGMLALLTATVGQRASRTFFLVAVALHYISATVLMFTTESGGWRYVQRTFDAVPLALLGWVAVYASGQVTMWMWHNKAVRESNGLKTG